MKKLVFIPVFNFIELLPQIVGFYRKYLDEAIILIHNDGKPGVCDGFERDDVWVIDNTSGKRGLKNAIDTMYWINHNQQKADIIIINEHDVLPNVESLYACLHIFEEDVIENFASVSCVYKWKDILCYPSHPNWYKDKPIFERTDVGKITKVASQGIPFGFSLWKPDVFKHINKGDLPDIWKLDYLFGKYVYEGLGLYHLRLLNYYVDHYNKGVRSWKEEK